MAQPAKLVTRLTLFDWVKRSSMKIQISLVIVIVITVFARVLPLEMQKKIVNQAINLRKLDLLYMYCGFYLAAVVTASGLKFVINALQTYLGQKALADMRKELYAHILTLPVGFFRKTPSGMVVSALVTELASASEFVGQAVAVPLTNIMTLFAFAGYMLWLNPVLAAISLTIYPLALFFVPKLQRRTNKANKERVDATREMSSKIGEAITGIHEIHGNGSYLIECSKYDGIVERLNAIRLRWNLYKYGTKVLNNFFVNLGPFFLFIIGGWLAINGRFDLGALVAFLSAQEKLFDPWKEIMDFYQIYQDASVSYTRTMEYFDMEPEHALEPVGRPPQVLSGDIGINHLGFTVAGGIQLLSDINLNIAQGEQLALVGFSGSGKSTLALCIGQLYKYTSGHLMLGGEEIADLSKRDIVTNVGFVSQAPFIFDGTIQDNLLYSCRAMPGRTSESAPIEPTLDDQIEALQQTGLFVDVLRFGLNAVLIREQHPELEERIIRVRRNFQAHFGDALAEHVEFFDENRYLFHSTVAANLIFGSPRVPEYELTSLAANPRFLQFLDESQLSIPLISLGADLATQTVDILGSLPPETVFFRQSPIPPERIEEYTRIVEHISRVRLHELSSGERAALLDLALGYIPGLHKMVALPELLERLILEGRSLFRHMILAEAEGAVTFYRRDEYIHSQTILDNILFGKTTSDSPKAQEKISQSINQLLIEEDLLETVVEIGMGYEVGTKGDKLSGGQRQKLAIARVLLKNPRVLIMDEATSALDNRSQSRIQALLETKWKGRSTLIAVVHRLDTIKKFDKVAVMKAGKIVEYGPYDALMDKKGMLYELVRGAKAAG